MKIFGKNVLYEALNSNHKFFEVFLRDDVYKSDSSFVDKLKKRNIKIHVLDKHNMNQMFDGLNQGYGANVVLSGLVYDDAYAKAVEIQKETGATFLHPFDDEYVIAGQGTISLEIFEQLQNVDTIVCPIGGGGIISGVAVAAKSINPNVKIVVKCANATLTSAEVAQIVSIVKDQTNAGIDNIQITPVE